MRLLALQGHYGANFKFTSMTQLCSVSGCSGSAASKFSLMCSRHRSSLRRHGHQLQTAVTVTELRGYRNQVQKRRKANPQSPAWAILEERWSRVLAHAGDTLQLRDSGKPFLRHEAEAARHLQALGAALPASEVLEVALSMLVMRERRGSRFCSDRAFGHQLVRRVRGLAQTSSGSYYSAKTQRTHRVYRDLPPRTVERIAAHLMTAFGAAGIQLAGMELAQAEASASESRRLERALMALR